MDLRLRHRRRVEGRVRQLAQEVAVLVPPEVVSTRGRPVFPVALRRLRIGIAPGGEPAAEAHRPHRVDRVATSGEELLVCRRKGTGLNQLTHPARPMSDRSLIRESIRATPGVHRVVNYHDQVLAYQTLRALRLMLQVLDHATSLSRRSSRRRWASVVAFAPWRRSQLEQSGPGRCHNVRIGYHQR